MKKVFIYLILFNLVNLTSLANEKFDITKVYYNVIATDTKKGFESYKWDTEEYKKAKFYLRNKQYKKAINELTKAIEKEDAYALDCMSRLFYIGKGVDVDKDLSFRLFLRAAHYRIDLFPNFLCTYKIQEKPWSSKRILSKLQTEAKRNNPFAYLELGYAYLGKRNYETIIQNKQQSLNYFAKASDLGLDDATIQAAIICEEKGASALICKRINQRIKQMANRGNSFALYLVGKKLYDDKKYKEAIPYLKKAADGNENDAKKLLIEMTLSRKAKLPIKKYIESMRYRINDIMEKYKNDKNNAYCLAIYYNAILLREKSEKYFRIAAENGDTRAYWEAAMSLMGYKDRESILKRVNWIKKAIWYEKNETLKKVYIKSLLDDYQDLIKIYKQNREIDQVKKYERELFSLAVKGSDLGMTYAQLIMAENYELGRGVPYKSHKTAFRWYKKVAMKYKKNEYLNAYYIGFSRMKLGEMYFYGEGIKKNYLLSYTWLNLSLPDIAEKNRRYAQNLMQQLEQYLTRKQIIFAQNYDPTKEENNNAPRKNSSIIGTGFFIDNNYVLTNEHVVESCREIEVLNKDYKSIAALSAKDPTNDLAVLKTKKPHDTFLYFRAGKGIRVGEEIAVLGYPLGKLLGSGIKLTTGNISALTGLVDDRTKVQLTAPVQPGNSGGPLLDRSANVVGVIVARLERGETGRTVQNVNLAIKSNVAQMFLDINNIDYEVRKSKRKKELPDIADEAKRAVVQVVCHQ